MPEYVEISFGVLQKDNPTDEARLKTLLNTFNKMETEKLEWFTRYIKSSKLFIIGDPVCIFKEELKQAIYEEAVLSRKYYISRKSLRELTINIKKILEEKFNCVADIWIPLTYSNDLEAWEEACLTRDLGQVTVTAEKEFEGMGKVKVTFGDIM